LVDHLGVLILLLAVIAVTTLWLGVLVARPRTDVPAGGAGGGESKEPQAESVARAPVSLAFLGTLLLFVIWQALALLLVFWALAFAHVGFAVVASLLLPVLVGVGYALRRGVR